LPLVKFFHLLSGSNFSKRFLFHLFNFFTFSPPDSPFPLYINRFLSQNNPFKKISFNNYLEKYNEKFI